MVQFMFGFWCGCAASVLVGAIFFSNKLRQMNEVLGKDGTEKKKKGVAEKKSKKFLTGPRVLLVDDSRLGRTMMKEFLMKRECNVCEADSGRASIKKTQTQTFDLIFIDQNMPEMNGDETLRYLREKGNVPASVPVIAMGTMLRREQEEEYLKKGYAACLGKPIQENRLDEILNGLLHCDTSEEEPEVKSEPEPEEKPDEIKEAECDAEPEGFSYEKGLTNFDGNKEIYEETLVLFADLWEERKVQLRQFLEEENMPEYAILIHAIKGDSRTLGAEGFGELAYAQELQAKAGDAEAVRSGFAHVISVGDKTAEYFRTMLL